MFRYLRTPARAFAAALVLGATALPALAQGPAGGTDFAQMLRFEMQEQSRLQNWFGTDLPKFQRKTERHMVRSNFRGPRPGAGAGRQN